jgi:hypothetical protein
VNQADPEGETTPLDCHRGNPARPLDWRWRAAGYFRAGPRRLRRAWDDPWARRALRFARAAHRRGGLDHPGLAKADPALAGALALRSGPDRALRLAVEARLLADLDDAAIAARCGLPAYVVAAYEATFFAVRDRLGHADALLFTTFGPRLYDGDAGDDPEVTVKLLAYFGGPLVADALLALPGIAATPASAIPPADPRLADLFRLAVAAQAVEVDARTAPVLIWALGRSAAADETAAAVTRPIVPVPIAVATGASTPSQVRAEASEGGIRCALPCARCAPGTSDRTGPAPPAADLPAPGRPEGRPRAAG